MKYEDAIKTANKIVFNIWIVEIVKPNIFFVTPFFLPKSVYDR